ncbi:MAG: urease accessory protein UreE [Pseudomonadota bacterium]
MTEAAPTLPRAQDLSDGPANDMVTLDYEGRLLRRKRLVTEQGRAFLVDFSEVRSVDEGQTFVLDDDTRVAIVAAPEPLIEIRGDLARLAWHIGNRHTPCRVEPDRLLIREDHVLAAMLETLGATLVRVTEPFRPEGGAYGHGRTFGHSHGPGDNAHSHD